MGAEGWWGLRIGMAERGGFAAVNDRKRYAAKLRDLILIGD